MSKSPIKYFCKKCNRDSNQTEFYDGRHSTCKECYKKAYNENYNKKKEFKPDINFENVPTNEFIDEIIKEFNDKFGNLISENSLLITKFNNLSEKIKLLEDKCYNLELENFNLETKLNTEILSLKEEMYKVRAKSPTHTRAESPTPTRAESPTPFKLKPLSCVKSDSSLNKDDGRINTILKKINTYTNKELTDLCREFGVSGFSNKPKDTLIYLLTTKLNFKLKK